jgi:geranylgeranyl transferase type-2 subunit beta
MACALSRRQWLTRCAGGTLAVSAASNGARLPALEIEPTVDGGRLARETRDFVVRCLREDGSYAASPDPSYPGESDTAYSDLAAVTYAFVLARTLGWDLPHASRSTAFVRRHQKPDGRFVNEAGKHDPASDLGVLYNTTQGVVALHAMGERPAVDPLPVLGRLLAGESYRQLPWYTTSFFPLCCAALGRPFPEEWRKKLGGYMESRQAEDGYLGDHVAATFHMAHFYRLIGAPTPRADRMVGRVLRDQKPDGGWNIKEPDWDVHACFDAVFILRQLGGGRAEVKQAIDRGARWSLGCRNADGGFGHFPGRPSDMDAVYFQFGTILQAGWIPGVRDDTPDARLLGWGHAMRPGRND